MEERQNEITTTNERRHGISHLAHWLSMERYDAASETEVPRENPDPKQSTC